MLNFVHAHPYRLFSPIILHVRARKQALIRLRNQCIPCAHFFISSNQVLPCISEYARMQACNISIRTENSYSRCLSLGFAFANGSTSLWIIKSSPVTYLCSEVEPSSDIKREVDVQISQTKV